MNKKNFSICAGILIVILALSFGLVWYMKTFGTQTNQAWTTYTHRFDSGDVISIDYPKELLLAYGPDYGAAGEEKGSTSVPPEASVYVLHFYSRDTSKIPANIVIRQYLPMSETAIASEKSALHARNEVKQSPWHLGEWTAYEGFIPSINGNYLYDFYFNINSRNLEIEYSLLSESDRERVMSSIRLNGIQMSKFDSMQGWDWPTLKMDE